MERDMISPMLVARELLALSGVKNEEACLTAQKELDGFVLEWFFQGQAIKFAVSDAQRRLSLDDFDVEVANAVTETWRDGVGERKSPLLRSQRLGELHSIQWVTDNA